MARRKKKTWHDAVKEMKYGKPEPEVKRTPGRCNCGSSSFTLKVENGFIVRTCRDCEDIKKF